MKNLLSLICITFLMSSCVTSKQYVQPASSNTEDQNSAKIYVIRTKNYATAVPVKVFQNKKLIGILGPKSYISWSVDSEKGDVTIQSKTENKDGMVIKLEAGKTYYIRQKMLMGIVVARSKLELLNEIEGSEMLSVLKHPKIKEQKKKFKLDNNDSKKKEEVIVF